MRNITQLKDAIEMEIGALAMAAKIGCTKGRDNYAKDCESYFAKALNILHAKEEWQLQVVTDNPINKGFDLIDEKNKLLVQVTAQDPDSKKAENAFDGSFKEKDVNIDYRLIVLFLSTCSRHDIMKRGKKDAIKCDSYCHKHNVSHWNIKDVYDSVDGCSVEDLEKLEYNLSLFAGFAYQKMQINLKAPTTIEDDKALLDRLVIDYDPYNDYTQEQFKADLHELGEKLHELTKGERDVLGWIVHYAEVNEDCDLTFKRDQIDRAKEFAEGKGDEVNLNPTTSLLGDFVTLDYLEDYDCERLSSRYQGSKTELDIFTIVTKIKGNAWMSNYILQMF